MRHFGGGFGFGHNIPIDGASGIVNNGIVSIYSWVSLGLHFLICIAVILLIAYIFKRFTKNPLIFSRHTHKALELLNERYARGEIDTEEYNTRKKTLGFKVE
jgi:putative membrane protein